MGTLFPKGITNKIKTYLLDVMNSYFYVKKNKFSLMPDSSPFLNTINHLRELCGNARNKAEQTRSRDSLHSSVCQLGPRREEWKRTTANESAYSWKSHAQQQSDRCRCSRNDRASSQVQHYFYNCLLSGECFTHFNKLLFVSKTCNTF